MIYNNRNRSNDTTESQKKKTCFNTLQCTLTESIAFLQCINWKSETGN